MDPTTYLSKDAMSARAVMLRERLESDPHSWEPFWEATLEVVNVISPQLVCALECYPTGFKRVGTVDRMLAGMSPMQVAGEILSHANDRCDQNVWTLALISLCHLPNQS